MINKIKSQVLDPKIRFEISDGQFDRHKDKTEIKKIMKIYNPTIKLKIIK